MYTRLQLFDFDDFYEPTKVVTNHEPIKSGEFTEDGLFSEAIFGKDNEVDNIDIMGWIDFGKDTYVIHPLIYKRLEKLMKASVVDALCSFNMRIDLDGNFKPELDDDGGSIRSANIEDANIGLWEFKRNFPYYLNKYTPNDRKKFPEYRNILRWYLEGKVFINKLPVFSPKLRPAQIFSHDKTFQFSEINKFYNLIIKHSNNIKSIKGDNAIEEVQLQKVKILHRLQGYVNNVFDKLIDNIKGKRGVIRKNIMAGRVNHSSRAVIIPNPDLAVNEIVINYTAFINLYKIPLINLISLSEGREYIQAQAIVEEAELKYNEKIHRYMLELIHKTKNGLRAILNRNPSISISSIQIVKIIDVIPDVNNYIMEVSNNILSGLGGDYDGDVLNLIALFSDEQYQQLKRLDPTYLVISNNDGKFNRTYSVSKDNKLSMYLLNHNLGKKVEYEVID